MWYAIPAISCHTWYAFIMSSIVFLSSDSSVYAGAMDVHDCHGPHGPSVSPSCMAGGLTAPMEPVVDHLLERINSASGRSAKCAGGCSKWIQNDWNGPLWSKITFQMILYDLYIYIYIFIFICFDAIWLYNICTWHMWFLTCHFMDSVAARGWNR